MLEMVEARKYPPQKNQSWTDRTMPPKTLTITEEHIILEALLTKQGTDAQFRRGVRNYCMAAMMLEAGLRVGEVCRLKWSDTFWTNKVVKSITIRAEISKNGESREIPVSTRLSSALSELHRCYYCPNINIEAGFLFFQNRPAKGLTTRQVERIIKTAAHRSIGKSIHPHALRHTFASKLMRKVSMRTVQALLGHKSIKSTQVYTHPNGEDLKKAINAL